MSTEELPTSTPFPKQTPVVSARGSGGQWGQIFWQFVRFALVGCLNTFVDLMALNGLLLLWSAQNTTLLLLANSLAYAAGALNSFFLNRYWTFQRGDRVCGRELIRFAVTTLAGIVCNDLILSLLTSIGHPSQFSPTLWTNGSKIVAICGTILVSYLGMRLWVFVQSSQEAPRQASRRRSVRAQISTLEPISPAEELTTSSLTLVLPAYNEEQIIAATVKQALSGLEKLVRDFEIIVVNDGSSDHTGAILADLCASEPRLRVVTHPTNQGYGAALADGFAAARKDLTFFMDADGQFDIHDLSLLLPFINEYDAVIGYRLNRQDTWMRKLNAWGWKQVIRLALGIRVRDIDCAFKVLRTSFLHRYPLETRGAMINAELLYKLKCAGYTLKEVGVSHLPRQGGRATGANLRVIGRAFRELFLYASKWRRTDRIAHSASRRSEGQYANNAFQQEDLLSGLETTGVSPIRSLHRQEAGMSIPQLLALVAIVLASVFMNFYQLGHNGFGNLFYAAGVRSMADNLHDFFFVAYDPGGFVSVDKPPLGFWLQALSVKLFGFTPFSLFFPQALAGVLAVLLLWHLVRRHFGNTAGLLAALALAFSPLSVVTARNNTIDSTLVLTLLLGVWAIILAAETGKWRWLILSALLVGLGFNIKMMEAYLVVPAFGLLYLLAAPCTLWTRVGRLCLAALVLLAVSLSWALVVDLTPPAQRPYVGSSQNNSEISLAFGYNGIDRLLGRFGRRGEPGKQNASDPHQAASGEAATINGNAVDSPGQRAGLATDSPGPLRLLHEQLGGQISWLLPFALLGMLALAWQRRPRFQRDRQQQSLLLWGIWLLTMGAFFSVAGFFHSYYMTTLAPAICAFFGIGAVMMWRDYQNGGWRGWLLPFALVATAAEQISFIISNPDWGTWLIPLIALPCLLAALVLSVARMRPYLVFSPRVFMSVLSGGLAALLLTPAIWSLMPALQNAAISTPSAGPGRPGRFAHANAPASSTLIRYLEQNQGNATFLAAALSSRSTNALILATNKPVMAMGGFAGRDPILNTQKLATLVADGTVRFFLLNDPSHPSEQSEREKVSSEAFARSAGSFWSDRNTQTTLTTWITQHCTAIPASQWQASRHSASSETANNPTLLYDCATDK